ncbi:MAG: O-GlcNAc transferase [Phycisphaerae bacterium]|nr:MAG: O-GlcNAc transferase [Phycisphaerae bacterium]
MTLPGLALFLLTLVVFSPALRNGWTGWDDTAYVVKNPLMTAEDGLVRIWTSRESEQYYPLTNTSYWLQYRLWGVNPGGYHAVNVVLHAVNAVLCLALLRALGLGRLGACVGAGLFALHPTQVMSVAWIAEHKNTLCGVFAFAAMLCWERSRNGTRGGWWYAGAVVAFVLAMLAKSAVIGLPVAMAMMDRFVLGTAWRGALARSVPMLAAGAVLAVVTVVFEQKFVDHATEAWLPDAWARVRLAGAGPWVYAWHLVWPMRLSPVYESWGLAGWRWWLPLAGSVTVAALVWWWGERRRGGEDGQPRVGAVASWGVLHMGLVLGPVLGLVPFGNLAVTPVSDHFLYLATIGVFAAVGAMVERLGGRGWVVAGVLGAWLSVVSWRDTRVYRDAVSMWTRGVEVAPGSFIAHLGLAEGMAKSGRRAEAVAHYERAVAIRPTWPDGWELLAKARATEGAWAKAAEAYRSLLALRPGNVPARVGLAEALERSGRIEEALREFETAVAADGTNKDARLGLAKMYLGFARYQEALGQFRALTGTHPGETIGYVGAAQCLRALRRDEEAVATLRVGLAITPDEVPLLNMTARVLATARDDAVRKPAEAVALAERAAGLSQYENPLVLETLAAAYASHGWATEAEAVARRAAMVHRRLGHERAAKQCEANAERFAAGESLVE